MLRSRKINSRRTLTYRHSGSPAAGLESRRAPHGTMPVPGSCRIVFTPTWLRADAPAVLIALATPTVPAIAASRPAGAFQRPRDLSVLAMTPAIAPAGEAVTGPSWVATSRSGKNAAALSRSTVVVIVPIDDGPETTSSADFQSGSGSM